MSLNGCMQVIRSLDELVSDFEETSAVTTDQHRQFAHPVFAHARAVLHQSEQQQQQWQQQQWQQQHSQVSVTDVVAAVSRQLSEKFDLHDTLAGLAAM